MKESAAIGATDPASTGARQRTQVAREKWEESWIAQQRAATAVIAGESREQSAQIDATASRPATNGQEAQWDFRASPHRQAPAASFAELNAAQRTERDINLRVPKENLYPTAPSGSQVPMSVREQPPASDTQHASLRGASVLRQPSRSFAFWRDGQALDVAMRLQDPEKTGASVIAQLRQWLRGTGSRLRSVVINGRVAWREPEPRLQARRES